MEKPMIITIVLGVLILFSVVQAFQLNSLKAELKDEGLTVSSSSSSTSVASSGENSKPAAVPASIKDLPTMVGGC
mgnify:CR=1 FL=1|tara:strand:- start:393 stop:617 length:225 start_codon:yes stop_codon:yes gene_type:complete